MHRIRLPNLLIATALALSVQHANAFDTRFMRETPIAKFNEPDMRMLMSSALGAMNETPDGASVNWQNNRTGSSGSITPFSTTDRRQERCRAARFISQHKSLQSETTVNLCRQRKGEWRWVDRLPGYDRPPR